MKLNKRNSMIKSVSVKIGMLLGASLYAVGSAAQLIALEDVPLFLANNVGTNMVVSMDDSGSMARAYMPDGISGDLRRFYYRSAYYNSMYYDPSINYAVPKDSLGGDLSDASFTAAVNGIYYGVNFQDVIDLSSNYLAVYYHYSASLGRRSSANRANRSMYAINDNNGCDNDPNIAGANANVCQAQPAYYYLHYTQAPTPVQPAGCDATDDTDINCYTKVVINDQAEFSTVAPLVNIWGRTMGEEQLNFARWYQYYSTRGDAAKSALTLAFVPDNVRSSVRMARQTLNNFTSVQSGPPTAGVNRVAELTDAERANFYQWISSVPTSGGTPLRAAAYRAGEFYKTDNVYRQDPADSSSPLVSCRSNTHILVTDGFYNGSLNTGSINNYRHDAQSSTLPDGTAYNATSAGNVGFPIFPNNQINDSLADIIFHYWATDLRTDLADNVPPFTPESGATVGNPAVTVPDFWNPKNDPADWQHMTTYVVSFGLSGDVPLTTAAYDALMLNQQYTDVNGSQVTGWPSVDISNEIGVADDLYHAGLNGRGGFYSASDPNELVDVFQEITNRLDEMQSVAAPVVANSGRVSSDSLLYIASFNSEDWTGRLRAFTISDGSNSAAADDPADCSTYEQGVLCPNGLLWDAAVENTENTLPFASRNIFTYKSTATVGGAPVGTGDNFIWADLDSQQQFLLNNYGTDNAGEFRLAYIRGDSSMEQKNNGPFKTRPKAPLAATDGRSPDPSAGGEDSRLGAIVHSSPIYVGRGVDGNNLRQFDFPDDLEAASYTAFLTSISGRPEMIYVGANDGMMHAYYAGRTNFVSGATTLTPGQEVFGYVPNAVYPSLHDLTETTFQSGSYVDGPIKVQDVFIGGSWRTLLVGALRTGGQGFYALDVTDPLAPASSVVKWEFTDVNDADMGYSFGTPQIVRTNSGQWVVIVSSGYNSTVNDGNVGSGQAALFILDAETGTLLKKFSLESPGGVTAPNGLSEPVAISVDGDLNVDYVYAGDIQGNMWKFDISDPNIAQWNDVTLLYSAGTTRPITSRPLLGTHPANLSGRLVYFGTGKYLESSDVTSTDLQAFYGIWDQDSCTAVNLGLPGATTATATACVGSGSLLSQVITGNTADGARTISNLPMDWNNFSGWTFNLSGASGTSSSEKITTRAFLIESIVVFLSVIPDGDLCGSNGVGYLYGLDRNNGGSPSRQVWDTNNDGIIDSNDSGAGIRIGEFGSGLTTLSGDGGPIVLTGYVDENGQAGTTVNSANNPGTVGRVRWRQLR